jgi:hypothetical protein
MKRRIAITLMMLISAFALKAQTEFKPGGSGIGTVFFNYRYDLTEDVTKASSFNLDRAYLGYKYDFTQKLSGRVIFDISYSDATKSFSAFAKNAFIEWTALPQLKISLGLIPIKHFDWQEKVWGYRYIMKTFTDEYGMGTTADLGVNFELPLHEMLSINAYIINGEGFKGIQDPFGVHKFGINATVKPVEGLSFRAHYDMMGNKYETIAVGGEETVIRDTSNISVITLFAGYEVKDFFRIGAEYNMMNNATQFQKYAEDRQLSGLSVFGAYTINPKWEVFARYDYLTSNTLDGDEDPWNFNRTGVIANGSMVIGGLQYKLSKGVNLALNYRTYMFDNSEDYQNTSGIYLNLGMFF